MDDRNLSRLYQVQLLNRIQIPLWTIETYLGFFAEPVERTIQIPLWTIETTLFALTNQYMTNSNSSMDDRNAKNTVVSIATGIIQIPLWTIETST